jgi:hypothetical protein
VSNQITTRSEREREFELSQRKAKMYASSTMVPKEYQDNIANVVIAQNMADRMGADLLMVMQNLYIVHGKPGWSSQFLIACFNSCGRFSSIRYRLDGEGDNYGCVAYATELETGEVVESVRVTIGMAKAEGWYGKAGSKWKTMHDLMLRYRSATFLVRCTAPEIGMGLPTADEITDIGVIDSKPRNIRRTPETTELAGILSPPKEAVDYEALANKAITKVELMSIGARVSSDEGLSDEVRAGLCEMIDERIAIVEGEGR